MQLLSLPNKNKYSLMNSLCLSMICIYNKQYCIKCKKKIHLPDVSIFIKYIKYIINNITIISASFKQAVNMFAIWVFWLLTCCSISQMPQSCYLWWQYLCKFLTNFETDLIKKLTPFQNPCKPYLFIWKSGWIVQFVSRTDSSDSLQIITSKERFVYITIYFLISK